MKDDKINGASARPEEPQDDFEVRERKRWTFFGLPFTFTTYTLTPKKLTVQTGLFTTAETIFYCSGSWIPPTGGPLYKSFSVWAIF